MQSVTLRKHQKILYKDILKGLGHLNKILLYAMCGCGKTVIALTVVEKFLKEGKRILISAYARSEIRTQWCTEIKEKFGHLLKDLQVVCAVTDIPFFTDLGIYAVTSDAIDKNRKIIVSIPQTMNACDLGKFDLIIVDEAHEYLDIKDGVLLGVITRSSKKNTKILGLSGTAYELMKEGSFFYKAHHVIYDLLMALEDKVILDCKVMGEFFKFDLPSDCYNAKDELNDKGLSIWKKNFSELNNKGKRLLKQKSYLTAKLERILKEVSGKTIVFVPKGKKDETFRNEQVVADFINFIMGNNHAAVIKTSSISDNSRLNKVIIDKNEAKFRSPNSTTNFMVVVGMCGTGWDYTGLNNVIDLTFSKNPKVIIQRQSRAIRVAKGKTPQSNYYYCIDQSMSIRKAIYTISNALSLMTKRRILNNDDTVSEYFFSEDRLKIYGGDEDRQLIPISTGDLQYCEGVNRKQFYTRTYRELCQEKDFAGNFLYPILDYGRTHKAVKGIIGEYANKALKRGLEVEDVIQKVTMAVEDIPYVIKNVFGCLDIDTIFRKINFDKTNRCFL